MRIAFKEWAIVVDALGSGRQIIILRKGGISEGGGGFQVDQPEFLLFPTLYHQQRESVIPPAQARHDEIGRDFPGPNIVRLELFARVEAWKKLETVEEDARLRGQHIWKDEVIAERFAWGREKNIHVMAVRVFRLPERIELPMEAPYAGCKSWVEIGQEIRTEGAAPVLDERDFSAKLAEFHAALNPAVGG